jgi:glycosyltransferase involved in cell wall biosynthesis
MINNDTLQLVYRNQTNKIKPIVSVHIVTYMHEQFISKCLEGILNQKTNFPIEIIINDDASTDNTQKIISDFQKKYPTLFKVIFQTSNQFSVFGFKNIKIQMYEITNGKYITFCEGDDYWCDPYKLQKQVDFLENNDEYIIHSGSAKIIRNNSVTEEIIGSHDYISKSFQIKDFFYQNNLVTCTVMYRNIINKNDSDFFNDAAFGDWYQYVFLMNKSKKKAYRSSDILSVYRIHDKGIYNGMDLMERHESYIKQINLIKKLVKYKKKTKLIVDSLNFYCFEKYKIAVKSRKYTLAFKIFLQNLLLTKFRINLKDYLQLTKL